MTNQTFTSANMEAYRDPDMPMFFASITRVMASPYDFTMIFGAVDIGIKADAAPRIKEMATVTMSPQHAKALVAILAGRVAFWEKQYGVMPSLGNAQIDFLNVRTEEPPTDAAEALPQE